MTEALFHRDGDAVYVPTGLAVGPWNPSHLHGGAPAGLLAHVLSEQAADLPLARLSIDLLRPVPRAPLTAHAEVVRAGRRLRVVTALLHSDGVEVSRATALFLEQQDVEVPDHARFAADVPAVPDDAPQGSLSDVAAWLDAGETPPGLHTTAEARLVAGVDGRGVGTVWMRLPVPVVAGTDVTPTVQAAALSDFANGAAQLRLQNGMGTINADSTLYLHRTPAAGWLGIEACSRMESHGRGLVEATLYDAHGVVGRVTQATLAMPVYASGS